MFYSSPYFCCSWPLITIRDIQYWSYSLIRASSQEQMHKRDSILEAELYRQRGMGLQMQN